MRKILVIMVAVFSFGISAYAQKVKTIHVFPTSAKIIINGSEVATGEYPLKFDSKHDYIVVKFIAPSYYSKTVKIFKNDSRKDISFNLQVDEAEAASVGGEAAVTANKWNTVTVKKGTTEDQVWRKIMAVVSDNFEDIEMKDKAAGLVRTAWVEQNFGGIVVVRTRLEIKPDYSQDDLGYQIKLSSEFKWADANSQGYEKYDRVLKKYQNVINDLQNRIGGGE
jgi:hypothetical protein